MRRWLEINLKQHTLSHMNNTGEESIKEEILVIARISSCGELMG
jgi:hypothetical protein